ncbi:MAG TPA: hypothetical protein VGA98_11730 [Allosphingosinicella sp.]
MAIFNCGDTRNYMAPFGYGTIRLPKASIRPLLMLAESGGRLTPLGPLASTFQAGAAPVPLTARERVANLSGSASTDLDASIGVDILGNVIGALSGSTLGIKAAYRRARKVTFEFGDVWENLVDITALDQFLSSASVAGNAGNYLKEMLEDDEVYCIYSTVDALQISVDSTAEGGASLGLEIPTIQQLVGGKVSVAGSGASSSKITYTSTELPLAFGLKAVRLYVDDGRYTTLKIAKAKNSNLAAALANPEAPDEEIATFAFDLEA